MPGALIRGLALLPLAATAFPAAGATCTAVASVMAFGIYDTLVTSPTDTTATVQVSCTPGVAQPLTTPYTISIAGTGTGNDAVRSLSSGAYRLYFQAYKDVGRTTVWGNGTTSGAGVASSVTSAATGVPAVKTHTVYSRLPARQQVAPGTYTGTLLVTVDY